MTNYNKLNATQKELMAQFMGEHPDLARNLLPNCAQGKATSNRLWEDLSKRLNAVGPPIKNAKLWKKAFADQKYNAKKKLSYNKASERRTGGGPYEEKSLTPAEELLVEAAGIVACVEGNASVPAFGNTTPSSATNQCSSEDEASSAEMEAASTSAPKETPRRLQRSATPMGKKSTEAKTALLEKNIMLATEHQQAMHLKFDRLLEISEKQLEIKKRQLQVEERQLEIAEETHRVQMATRQIEYKIKCIELQVLQEKMNKD